MHIPMVDLHVQYEAIKSQIDAAIANVLDSCAFILGPEVTRFEQAFADYHQVSECVAVSNGTDAPVENVSPVASYYATVSRKLDDGSIFYPDQRLSRLDALRTYTINAAYAAFEEDLKGSLTPGKLADITVLSKNILTVPEEEIPSTEVVYTIVGGRVMYQR